MVNAELIILAIWAVIPPATTCNIRCKDVAVFNKRMITHSLEKLFLVAVPGNAALAAIFAVWE
jgi:hypothetical protein